MKVVYVCADAGIPIFGNKGGSVHVREILHAFLKRGDTVTVLAANAHGDCPPELRGIRVIRLDTMVDAPDQNTNPRRFDDALRRALKTGIAECDLVYERHALWSVAAMKRARELQIPSVLEVNAPLVDEQCRYRRLDDPLLADLQVAEALEAATVRVAVSRGVAEAHGRYGLSVSDFLVCPNGVSVDRFQESRRSRADRSTFTIGFLGTLKPWHGLEVLIEAFERLADRIPTARLHIVGDGPMRNAIESRVDAAGLKDRVVLTGAVSSRGVPARLATFDVGVAPYPVAQGHYFSPLKIFEYMASALPVVASRVGQIEDLIEDGVDGILVEPGDADALAKALIEVERSGSAACTMGANARARVSAHHGWDDVLSRILANIELSPPSRGRSTNQLLPHSIGGSG